MSDLRVYLSSTYSDLREYRQAAIEIIRRLGLSVVALEHFGTAESPPLQASLRAVDSADIVVVLVAHRLGVVPEEVGKSLVEMEYERALEAGKPILCFVLDANQPWPPALIDTNYAQVEQFRKRIAQTHRAGVFTTPDDLAVKIAAALAQYSRIRTLAVPESTAEKPQVGSEGVAPPSSEQVLAELRTLRADFAVLQQLVADSLRRQPFEAPAAMSGRTPAEFLGAAAPAEPRTCFVVMPYSQDWSSAVEKIILEACTLVGLDFEIAKNMPGRFIPNDIWRGITRAGVLVADLSGANANVAYEVGLADVLGKQIILIGQDSEVPFDFQAQRLIRYQNSLPGSLTLREELESRLRRYCESIADARDA
jgi:ABC-type amino acid transport substrate-binding protein